MKGHRLIGLWGCAALGTLLAVGCSRQAKLERHLTRGDAYYKAGDWLKAEVEYLNVVRLQPTNHFVLRRLATMYSDQGRANYALRFWQAVVAQDPTDIEGRIKLGYLLSRAETKTAREHALYVLDRQPTNSEALLLLCDTSRQPEEITNAFQRLEAVAAQMTNQADFHLARRTLYLRQTNAQAAEQALRQALAVEPNSAHAHAALAEHSWRQGDLTNANLAFQKAASLAQPQSRIPLRWAEFKSRTGPLHEAKALYQQLSQQRPHDPEVWLALAKIALLETNYTECAALLNKVQALDPDNDETTLWRARLQQAQGKPTDAIKILEALQRDYPRLVDIPLQLASAHLQNQDPQKAVAALRQALSINPDLPQTVLLLAELNLRLGDADAAALSLQDLVRRHPGLDRAWFLLATAYSAQRRFDEALSILSRMEKAAPTNALCAHLKGVTLRQLQRNIEARAAFEKALQLAPDDLLSLAQLVDLELADKQTHAAAQRVQAYLARHPNSALAKILEARVFLAQTNLTQAEAALQKALELDPNAGPAYDLLVRLYLGTHRTPQALEQLQQVLARNPKDRKALLLTALIYEQAGQLDKAQAQYESLIKVDPKNVPALNNLAYLLSAKLGKHDQAYPYAIKARELAPQDPAVADTLGWVLFGRREFARALTLLQESASKSPDNPEIQYHLGMAHYMMGQEAEARTAFQRVLSLDPNFPDRAQAQSRLTLLATDVTAAEPALLSKLEERVAQQPDDLVALLRLAQGYGRRGDAQKARQHLEQARAINSNSVPVLVELARLYSGPLTNHVQALALAREARRLAPQDPQLAHLLGQLAYRAGDFAWAASLLQESAQRRPQDPEVLFDLAHALYHLGRVDEASQAMQRALGLGGAFAHQAEAQWFVTLAGYLAQPAKAAQAEPQLQQLLKAKPDYVPAMMATALVHEQRGRWAEARQLYERILDRAPGFTPAMKQLAAVYSDHLADHQRAFQLALRARQALPEDPDLAKTLGKIAYRRSDYPNANRYLQEASVKRADDAELVFFLGMTQLQLKQTNAAKATLQRALTLAPNASFAPEAKQALAKLQ